MMIAVDNFVEKVAQIEREKPSYRLGGSAKDGTCDCIGLVIGAIGRAGGQWNGIHGSNWTARNEVTRLRKVSCKQDMRQGELVFKAKKTGEGGWALPARYRNGTDQNDYYHVGVVVTTEPLVIVHCTTPTVMRDKKLGKWSYAAWLKCVAPIDSNKTDDGLVLDRVKADVTKVGIDGAKQTEVCTHDKAPTLRKGSRGDWVAQMQKLLIANGFALPRYGADGTFGNETLAAVRQFQLAVGLPADGICGAKTWDALTA